MGSCVTLLMGWFSWGGSYEGYVGTICLKSCFRNKDRISKNIVATNRLSSNIHDLIV
jgi:hypothetical protein